MNAADIKAAVDAYDAAMNEIGTCGDGNCLVIEPVGMHTNGGCRCWQNKMTAQRVMIHAKRLRTALAKINT